MTQMKIQRTQRGAAAARAAASQAGKGRFSGPGIMSNKVWLGVVMSLLMSGMALQAFAVVAPSWLRVRCQRGSLTVGLWTMCGDPLQNITWPRFSDKSSSLNQSNSSSGTKLESRKRSIGTGDEDELSGSGGEERMKVNTSRWLLFWDNCLEMVTDDEHPHPVWFQATQLLETMGLGCTGITTLLLMLYACAPTFMALQVALGFAAASFTAGGFIIVGMFNISGGKFDVGVMLPPDVTCNIETSSLYYSFKLASVSVSLLGVAGAVATLASILEKGDAHQNRMHRKGEEPPPADPGGEATASAAGSPTPPSTISDNESTPMSFESIYESDYTYPNSLRKKVSFQNREQLAAAVGDHQHHLHNPGNSIHVNTIPAPANIPQSVSASHIYKPIPRRLSVQSMSNHQDGLLPSNRRQSSPLRIYQPVSTQPSQPLTLRQDSISSRGSNMSNSSRSRESQDRRGRYASSRNSSRNSMQHHDNPNRRSSRT